MGGGYKRVYSTLRRGFPTENSQLKNILEWCTKNVEFYKPYAGHNPCLDRFPVINKSIIRENELRFLAPQYDKSKLFRVSTSGSTGTPFSVYQDSRKRQQAAADTIAFSEYAGYHFGTRLYYVRAWDGIQVKGNWYSALRNIVRVNNRGLAPEDFKKFLEQLENDPAEKSVLIYASTLTELYRYMVEHDVKTTARVQVFITMSESLPEDVRKGISQRFNAPVISRYSDCECGLIAQQEEGGDDYRVNWESFFVEILKLDSDESAREGNLGRIVITDLYNFAMPLIRYDTGDLGVMETRGNAKVLARVEGRRMDCVYSTDGKLLSPHAIRSVLLRNSFSELRQYQFIQEGASDYTIKLCCAEKTFSREKELATQMKELVGEEANLKFEFVDEIPVLSSGKRKLTVNNYKP